MYINSYGQIVPDDYLMHHGILGMKWGKKNGPPYPLDASDHSASEKRAGWQDSLENIAKATGRGVAATARGIGRATKATGRAVKSTVSNFNKATLRLNLKPKALMSDEELNAQIQRIRKNDELKHLLGRRTKSDKLMAKLDRKAKARAMWSNVVESTLKTIGTKVIGDNLALIGKKRIEFNADKRKKIWENDYNDERKEAKKGSNQDNQNETKQKNKPQDNTPNTDKNESPKPSNDTPSAPKQTKGLGAKIASLNSKTQEIKRSSSVPKQNRNYNISDNYLKSQGYDTDDYDRSSMSSKRKYLEGIAKNIKVSEVSKAVGKTASLNAMIKDRAKAEKLAEMPIKEAEKKRKKKQTGHTDSYTSFFNF